MWVMTNTGFLGLVAHRDWPDHLLERARRAVEFESVFPKAEVTRTHEADYLFRATIDRSVVAETIAQQLVDIDYDNFRNSIMDPRLQDAYIDAWSVKHRYQTENSSE